MSDQMAAGVLSQTLASSPCIKSILSAKIRTPLLNDVVMVGHSSIHLRELTQTGQLSNVIANLDFGVQILAAKVISAEQYELSTADAILENGRDEIRYKIRGEPCDDSQPPQIVVVSIASSELIFVYARSLPDGGVQFVYAKRNILGGYHWPSKYGKHLAVDPQSRALAVASAKGSFGIMCLKQVDEIKADIDSWDPRDPLTIKPITEQRFAQVDGVILRMDFLRSSEERPGRLILLLFVANQGVTLLLLYRWDSWRPLIELKAFRGSGQPLPEADAFPHLLIPSCRQTAFAIVTKENIVFYDNVGSKSMKRKAVSIPKDRGASTDQRDKDKQWVQYAKPVRHEKHRKTKEDIFLIREDGLLKTLVVTHSTQTTINFDPGHLGIHVDTAVCALSAPPTMGGDILIACGDTTEGGVYHLAATIPPRLLQPLPNWSPIRRMIIPKQSSVNTLPHDHGMVLATTGLHENRAALTELRYGNEAQVELTIPLEEASTIDHLWMLERAGEARLLLLSSHHEHTTILSYDLQGGELTFVDPSSYPQLCFDSPTLAVGKLAGDTIVQITSRSINVLPESTQTQFTREPWMSQLFVCADMHSSQGVFIVVKREAERLELIGGIADAASNIVPEVSLLPTTTHIEYPPVAMKLARLSNYTVALCGSQDGCLYAYGLEPDEGFLLLKRWALIDLNSDVGEVSISSLSILELSGASRVLVVCGLKSGKVMLFELYVPTSEALHSIALRMERTQVVGTTSVTIKAEEEGWNTNCKSAYVMCGSNILRIQLFGAHCSLDYAMDRLLITNRDSPSYLPPTIDAVDRVGKLSSMCENDPSGLLACVAGDEILLLRMGRVAMLPRPIRIMHPTKHLVYSQYLRKCIASVQGKRQSTTVTQLQDRPSVQLLDPNTSPELETKLPKSRFYFGEKGEKVKVLLHWAPTDGSSHYDMLIIGTDVGSDGRISYMIEQRMSQPKPGGTAKAVATYPNKSISAICPYGPSSLIVCAGRDLKLLHLDVSSKRWEHQGDFELPSSAMHLRAKGSVVFVATSLHSFMLLREQQGRFKMIGNDSWAGNARHTMPYGDNFSLIINLVSDHGSRILNFTEHPRRGSTPIFEAVVPQAIDNLAHFEPSSASDGRDRFLGSTIDGSVYLFTTLTEAEMKLLRFLEQLCEPVRNQAARSAGMLAQIIAKKYANKLESVGVVPPTPTTTHARGDILKTLLEHGPYSIHSLLQRRVKMESQDAMVKEEDELDALREVAQPVLGKTDNIVERVVVWLRRLLNVPAF